MRIASLKFQILSFMKKQQQQKNNPKTTSTAFSIFPESSCSMHAGTYLSQFWMHCTCAKDRNDADLLSEVLCA